MAFEFDYDFTDADGDRLTIQGWSALDDKSLTIFTREVVELSESAARDLANFLLRWADGIKE